MKNELIEAISNIKETETISKILLNMNNRDIFNLFTLLNFTDDETQKLWSTTYTNLIKY